MKAKCLPLRASPYGTGIWLSIVFGVLLQTGLPSTAGAAENPLSLRVHHITASVADMQRAIGWYQSVLGFKLKEQGSHGDMQFAVLGIPGFEVALVRAHETLQPVPADSPHWIHIVFSAPDPNRLFQELKDRGAAPYMREKTAGEPVKSFLIRDSEGNEIEIVAAEEPGSNRKAS